MNNNCKQFEEQCSLYVENELPEHERRRFEAHLRDCSLCQQTIVRLELLRVQLKNIPRLQPSRDFETILRARIQMTKQIGLSPWAMYFQRLKVPAYAVSITAIAAAILFFHLGSPTGQRFGFQSSQISFFPAPLEAQIQPGDVVYPVDFITPPEKTITLKVTQAQKSQLSRSMIVAPVVVIPDSSGQQTPRDGQRQGGSHNVPVSF